MQIKQETIIDRDRFRVQVNILKGFQENKSKRKQMELIGRKQGENLIKKKKQYEEM